MFEQLFRFPSALNPHLSSPLVEERRRFLCHRAEEGIGRNGLRVLAYYLLACVDYLRLAERPGELITRDEVERQAKLWAGRVSPAPNMRRISGRRSSRIEFLRHACAWLKFMGRLQESVPTSGRFADELGEFARFLDREKGLNPGCSNARCAAIGRFLELLTANTIPLHKVTISMFGEIKDASFDRGFYSEENKAALEEIVEYPCLPQKQRTQYTRCMETATLRFKQARQRHPGIESAIGALQSGNGLKRCRDRSESGFGRYLGLAILGRNMHTLANC
ncbi:hypothetical protein V7x_43090 [Crateriforma conspicua]|uniref:Uncharacterized protein n=1 Tax=Crateriforma conspicua TaxID=2527996 RepID=A0A5C6FMQ9_9PLAN|nr:hypothetical protein [Crateriforma conspicua]TWU62574.1 hypothetical protein V7x_43090 [Crateriforma conspicua]